MEPSPLASDRHGGGLMARVRWARKCAAHKKNGDPCGNYAITGGRVCRMHGGAAPQVRRAAEMRLLEASAYRALAVTMDRLKRDRLDWAASRILATSDVLDIEVAQVTRSDIWWAAASSDHPALHAPEPKPRRDLRYGPRPRKAPATTAKPDHRKNDRPRQL